MIIKTENRIEFRSHNGRYFNIIITYEADKEEFHLSTPGFSKFWHINQPIENEIHAVFKTKAELKEFNNFIQEYIQ